MNAASSKVVVCGSFDDLRSSDIRFLEEASGFGPLKVLVWPDAVIQRWCGRAPRFAELERLYLLRAIRFVASAELASAAVEPDALPVSADEAPGIWIVHAEEDTPEKRRSARGRGWDYRALETHASRWWIDTEILARDMRHAGTTARRVVATGCYDWLHSGHVRFFEELSAYGELHVVVGHDANIRLLKGAGHPLLPQEERRYLVGAVRHVKRAWISSGMGWLDAEPEIARIRPDIYAVNEDGDREEKRRFCAERGIEYLVLKRTPAPGLPQRSSTHLRGF